MKTPARPTGRSRLMCAFMPRERELQRGDVGASARGEEGRPGARHGGAVLERAQRGEVQIAERDVERAQEGDVAEDPALALGGHHVGGHRQIELVEAGDAVGGRQGGVDRLLARPGRRR